MGECPACVVHEARKARQRRLFWSRVFFCLFGFHKDQISTGRYGYIRYECEACGREKLVEEE